MHIDPTREISNYATSISCANRPQKLFTVDLDFDDPFILSRNFLSKASLTLNTRKSI